MLTGGAPSAGRAIRGFGRQRQTASATLARCRKVIRPPNAAATRSVGVITTVSLAKRDRRVTIACFADVATI
jgi:hypothetical protein